MCFESSRQKIHRLATRSECTRVSKRDGGEQHSSLTSREFSFLLSPTPRGKFSISSLPSNIFYFLFDFIHVGLVNEK